MLAKGNRVTRGADYRAVVRRGAKSSSQHLVTYAQRVAGSSTVRFGFIVGKTVGIANRRNLVRRRLKALSAQLLPTLVPGTDVVIRALPGAAEVSWATLQEEVFRTVGKVGTR
ncbi:ribonuclease P protein component [Rathayibacter soli]|uniref:ribonuclease P protein component n=1 Tax=Rathayibacter soli TaxID=3144168 RepID=UPI0027E4C468|nr:ribonuclease P protein component [Glaciibacter superstes]